MISALINLSNNRNMNQPAQVLATSYVQTYVGQLSFETRTSIEL